MISKSLMNELPASLYQFLPRHASFFVLFLVACLTHSFRLNARHSMQERNEDGVSISISKLRTADYVFPAPAGSSLPLANDNKVRFSSTSCPRPTSAHFPRIEHLPALTNEPR